MPGGPGFLESEEPMTPVLHDWESFYVIVGTSAGALTGLQFVVMTLVGQAEHLDTAHETIAAFGTPNVVHFAAALLFSSIGAVPWGTLHTAGTAVATCGGGGVLYVALALRRALRQSQYRPVPEDWVWYFLLPVLAYGTLVFAGVNLDVVEIAPDLVGAATLGLVFLGIHNAWDTVTFVVLESVRK
jgi:hypothetical protein